MVRNRTRINYVAGIKQTLAEAIQASCFCFSQKEIAGMTGLNQGEVSQLRHSKGLERFTIDRLIMILDALGWAVSISVSNGRQ
jgi:predicted XRE-type DNA-binding protein